MQKLYTATATVTGGREGHGRTSDGKIDVDLSLPKELGGPGGEGTNPEQLFAVAYAACFLGAVKLVAQLQKKDVGDASITSNVSVIPDNGGWKLAAELHCKLPGVSQEEAEVIVNKAHQDVCPYSKATRGNIDVALIVE
ncbi:MAG: organic hydroperoxide resistance protein [Armatimonadota bacterium]|nr:organic hydroperoxide resistance protein [bacterium]